MNFMENNQIDLGLQNMFIADNLSLSPIYKDYSENVKIIKFHSW